MSGNYLLHSKIAENLFFDYVKNIPTVDFCPQISAPSLQENKAYNNIAEAWLINDSEKLSAMRKCGVEEKYTVGNASDYEKFKEFCRILPRFAGHPLYLLSHIELRMFFDCELFINENNCDTIWCAANEYIAQNALTPRKCIEKANVAMLFHPTETFGSLCDLGEDINPVFKASGLFRIASASFINEINELAKCSGVKIEDLSSLETALEKRICDFSQHGCTLAVFESYELEYFVKPNQYEANQAFVKALRGEALSEREMSVYKSQLVRILALQYKKAGFGTLVHSAPDKAEEALSYLKSNGICPKYAFCAPFELAKTDEHLEAKIRLYAKNEPLGNAICYAEGVSLAKHDYFKRVLCNIFARMIENGEFENNLPLAAQIIEKMLYSNIKELL